MMQKNSVLIFLKYAPKDFQGPVPNYVPLREPYYYKLVDPKRRKEMFNELKASLIINSPQSEIFNNLTYEKEVKPYI